MAFVSITAPFAPPSRSLKMRAAKTCLPQVALPGPFLVLPRPVAGYDGAVARFEGVAMRKWLIALVTVVLAATIGVLGTLRYYRLPGLIVQDRATLDKFAEIQEGMTLGEVEALMGKPYDGQCWYDSGWPISEQGKGIKGWTGAGTITIDVVLDHDDKVIAKRCHPNGPDAQERDWAWLRGKLGW
jgi:hypothetical protein